MDAFAGPPGLSFDAPERLRPQASGSLRFSLDGVPERERLPLFCDHFGRTMICYEVEPLDLGPIEVDVQFRALAGLTMMWGRVHGSENRRTREMLAHDATDDVGLVVNLRGPHRITHGRDEIVLGDGDATLVSLGEVASYTHRPPGDILALRVPRKRMAALVSGVDDRFLRRIPRGTPALRLLVDYLSLVQRGEDLATPGLEPLVVNHVHDLMAMAVGAARDAAEVAEGRGLRAARLRAVKSDIAGNLGRPDLSVASVARRQGCTERFVQRLFEAEGTTFTEYVVGQRLVRAYRMLSDPRLGDEKIASIAFDAGFADLSYFNRVFRRRYGETPSAVRSGAGGRDLIIPRLARPVGARGG